MALCVALSKNKKSASLARLYFSNGDNTGEGGSLFETKPNVNLEDFSSVLNLNPTLVANMLKDHFEEEDGSGYQVVLSINFEGAEVDVVESFYKVFSDRLIGVLGSLSDVQKVHGEEQLSALYRTILHRSPYLQFCIDNQAVDPEFFELPVTTRWLKN